MWGEALRYTPQYSRNTLPCNNHFADRFSPVLIAVVEISTLRLYLKLLWLFSRPLISFVSLSRFSIEVIIFVLNGIYVRRLIIQAGIFANRR